MKRSNTFEHTLPDVEKIGPRQYFSVLDVLREADLALLHDDQQQDALLAVHYVVADEQSNLRDTFQ